VEGNWEIRRGRQDRRREGKKEGRDVDGPTAEIPGATRGSSVNLFESHS
jgi:hypothetical protein